MHIDQKHGEYRTAQILNSLENTKVGRVSQQLSWLSLSMYSIF